MTEEEKGPRDVKRSRSGETLAERCDNAAETERLLNNVSYKKRGSFSFFSAHNQGSVT